jgi:DNA repair exonuclease SbcCD nuclease subunit
MKLIHCSDIHLDSALNTHLTPQEAQIRQREILDTFLEMIAYAGQMSVRAVMISGDLFDTDSVSADTKNAVLSAIKENPDMDFLYLCGNHDEQSIVKDMQNISNVRLFPKAGKAYRYGNVVILGLNRMDMQDKIHLKDEDINIVMLHGTLKQPGAFAGKNIDYMALGHIHKYEEGRIDARGVYCYSGCLEPRGFDECGKKGFVLLETDMHSLKRKFVPFSRRTAHTLDIDITGVNSLPQIYDMVLETMKGLVNPDDMLRVQLTGEAGKLLDINTDYLEKMLKEECFIVNVKNLTKKFTYTTVRTFYDVFKDIVLESEQSDEMKEEIMDCAWKTLM